MYGYLKLTLLMSDKIFFDIYIYLFILGQANAQMMNLNLKMKYENVYIFRGRK